MPASLIRERYLLSEAFELLGKALFGPEWRGGGVMDRTDRYSGTSRARSGRQTVARPRACRLSGTGVSRSRGRKRPALRKKACEPRRHVLQIRKIQHEVRCGSNSARAQRARAFCFESQAESTGSCSWDRYDLRALGVS